MKEKIPARKRQRNPSPLPHPERSAPERAKAELQQARMFLQKERETYFPILHKAPYGIVLTEEDGTFLYINPEFTRITGYTMEEASGGKDWFHKASPLQEFSREVLRSWKKDVLAKGLEKVLPVICSGGEIKQIHFKPTLLDNGRVIVMLSDVTERKRAEEKLENHRAQLEELVAERTAKLQAANEKLQQEIVERKRFEEQIFRLNDDLRRRALELEAANKELETFSYSVSHDLRTPLIGIHGLTKKLLQRYALQLDPKAQQFLFLIQKDSQRMLQLIDNLFALSRFDHQETQALNIDMEQTAKTVYEEIKNLFPDLPLDTLQFKIETLPFAHGDPIMIRQVFFNLLANAIKFTRPRKTPVIEIGYLEGKTQNTYYVRDNGVGFDMQQAGKLFGVFQRLHSSDFEGTGIGLAIVRRIVTKQGGKVWAEGEVGKGATFYFTLPKGPWN